MQEHAIKARDGQRAEPAHAQEQDERITGRASKEEKAGGRRGMEALASALIEGRVSADTTNLLRIFL
jgi:hypothetical protein